MCETQAVEGSSAHAHTAQTKPTGKEIKSKPKVTSEC